MDYNSYSQPTLAARLAAKIVRGYQKTLSPDHGPLRIFFPQGYCRFHPTCSEYTRQAMLKYGLVRGIGSGVYRILRCNPWGGSGQDLP